MLRQIRYYPIMILYAVALHLVWATLGIIDASAYNATALSAIFRLFGTNASPIILLVVALLAFIGAEARYKVVSIISLLLPQQTILIVSAIGSLHAMVTGHFADGVIRPRSFIIADQLPVLLAAIGHTIAIVQFSFLRSRD